MTGSTINGIGVGTGLPVPTDPTAGYKDLNYKDPSYWLNSMANSSNIYSNVENSYHAVTGAANRHMLMAKAAAIINERFAQADADIAAIEAGDPAGAQKFMKNWHITEEIEKAFNEAEQGMHSISGDAISKASRS